MTWMLGAEPQPVQQLVADTKAFLASQYHALPSLNSLSLVELPMQSKWQQMERTLELRSLLSLGPSLRKLLPVAIQKQLFDRAAEDYLGRSLSSKDLSQELPMAEVRQMMSQLLGITTGAQGFAQGLGLAELEAFKMHRLLWTLVFFSRLPPTNESLAYPFAALYPLLDDLLDGQTYSKLQKTRLMERVRQKILSISNQKPQGASAEVTELEISRIEKCIDMIAEGIQRKDPFTKRQILEGLDQLRYAEELDFLDSTASDIDSYTRCAVKGTSTLRTMLLLADSPLDGQVIQAYGFVFQMVDDLQDCQADAAAGVQTPFSSGVKLGTNIDADLIRLLQYLRSDQLAELISKVKGPVRGRLQILNDFLAYLVMEAAMKHRGHLSVQCYRELRHRLPFRKSWCKRNGLEWAVFSILNTLER